MRLLSSRPRNRATWPRSSARWASGCRGSRFPTLTTALGRRRASRSRLAERIAAIRGRKAEERARAKLKAERQAARPTPGPVRATPKPEPKRGVSTPPGRGQHSHGRRAGEEAASGERPAVLRPRPWLLSANRRRHHGPGAARPDGREGGCAIALGAARADAAHPPAAGRRLLALPGSETAVENYHLYATFTTLGSLVGKYGFDRRHPAVRRRPPTLLLPDRGRRFPGHLRQPTRAHLHAGADEVLIEAGFGAHPAIERAFRWLLSTRQNDGGGPSPREPAA